MRHTGWRSRTSVGALAALCAAALSGCAAAPDRAEILIGTTPPGAACTLTRLGQPIATVGPTPAIALVEPGDVEIAILCRRNGFADAAVTLEAHRTEAGFGLAIGRWPYEYQHRVDIALTPKRP